MRTLAAETNPFLRYFAWFTAGATLLLICSGGMVTSKGVGMSVPDWPTTFGYNMFLFPISKWIGGVFFEHTHRLIASTVGFLTVVLAVWIWRTDSRRWMRTLGWIALGAVVLQGVLGGLRVTMLKDQIGIFHACLAQAFFGLLVFIALVTSRFWRSLGEHGRRSSYFWFPVSTCILIYLQLALGATMRHQHRDLSILDFPAAYGQFIPDTSPEKIATINEWRDARALSDVTAAQIWLQMAHRFMALLISIGVVACWFVLRKETDIDSRLRTLTTLWILLLFTQVTLGAWTIWSNKAADIATAHVAVGATMLAFGVTISALTWRGRETTIRRTDPMRQRQEAHAV